MQSRLSLEEQDKLVKEELINEGGNILVVANAGSGKTTFLAKKILSDVEREGTFQNFAALTFTNNARDEITNKLENIPQNLYVATIDGFLESEILEPFIEQVYPNVKPISYNYQKNSEFDSYGVGISKLTQEKIFGKYDFNTQKNGKNFKCEVAIKILRECIVAREYLTFKYKKIYLDEYQDCDSSMHQLFMYLKDELGITLVIVGDDKQSIYQWRGASPIFINSLFHTKDNNFTKKRFQNNFRSEPKIVDFSLAISNSTNVSRIRSGGEILYLNFPIDLPRINWDDTEQIKSEKNDETAEIELNIIKEIVDSRLISTFDQKRKFYFIGNNDHIKRLKERVNSLFCDSFYSYSRNILADCDNSTLLTSLAKYYFDKEYTEYHLLNDLYVDYDKSLVSDLNNLLTSMRSSPNQNIIEEIITYLGFSTKRFGTKLESEFLLEILLNQENKILFTSLNGVYNLFSTIHSSKGLSSDEVILFTNYLFDFKDNFKEEDNYVAITRPKSRLILIDFNGKYKNKINELLQRNNEIQFTLNDFAEVIK
ncbi:UvrD-helicase domain-containing protein [Streptococcus ovis]|uniref:UvrD-helicase domain-containing protein n=1 Tax=Streptococcus ovis TaxID=82806 RepID=UPI000370CFB8|nr:UvrD-helicase domain-containing protein [Streptococcus ovis]